jgi:hypothetical protein
MSRISGEMVVSSHKTTVGSIDIHSMSWNMVVASTVLSTWSRMPKI